ncbi:MAG: FAD:protein FMN transferase [Candidatus Coproplasma sp.]
MKRFICLASAVIIGCSTLCFTACNNDTAGTQGSYFMPIASYSQYKSSLSTMAEGYGYVMGTDAYLYIADEDNFATEASYNAFADLWEEVKGVLTSVENSISATIETSYIYRFNEAEAGATVELDQTAFEILSLAVTVYEQTEGYFNPAVYQSVRLYGFGDSVPDKPSTLPDENTVQAYKTLSESFAELSLSQNGDKYFATKPNTTVTVGGRTHSLKLDLGGIGKGWCADKINTLIDKSGFKYGYFNFGSSTMAVKSHNTSEGNFYTLSVADPRSSGAYAKFKIKDKRLSTSGDYEQYYEVEGTRYCHIIDPTTGSPIQTGIASVTVVGGSAAEDDALTTALSAMGKQKAVEYINGNLSDRLVIMLVIEKGQGKIICNRPDEITVVNTAYTLGNTVEEGKIILN